MKKIVCNAEKKAILSQKGSPRPRFVCAATENCIRYLTFYLFYSIIYFVYETI